MHTDKKNERFLPSLARQSPHQAFYWYLFLIIVVLKRNTITEYKMKITRCFAFIAYSWVQYFTFIERRVISILYSVTIPLQNMNH